MKKYILLILALVTSQPAFAVSSAIQSGPGGVGGKLLGYIEISGVTADAWLVTSTTMAAYPAAAAATYVAYGLASAPATKVPGIKISSIPAGVVTIQTESAGTYTGNASIKITNGFYDGSTYFGQSPTYTAGASYTSPFVSGSKVYTSDQSNITFTLASAGSSGSVYLQGGNSGFNATVATMKIYVFWSPLGY